ncbi:MAG: Mini-ribonuclease 3 [Christensenellales bacterium]
MQLLDDIIIQIKVDEKNIKNYSMLSLAFLGDSIHSLFVREKLIEKANFKVKQLHSNATKFVKAKAQSFVVEQIFPLLTEEEQQIIKTAKNSKTNNIAKNSSVKDYKNATAFESLLGYTALKQNLERLNFILNLSFSITENQLAD